MPMLHEAAVLSVVVRQTGEIARVVMEGIQVLGVDGKACVHRVTAHVNDARIGK